MSFRKYKAKRIEIDWIKFDSKLEWAYYEYLRDKQIQMEIHPRYELQAKFTYQEEKVRAIYYIADFSIIKDWIEYVIDIKGMPTENAKLKRKLFMYKYPEKVLQRLVRYKGERVNYFDNEKRKKDNRKKRLNSNQ